MTTWDILYEIGQDEAENDGARLCEVFLQRFIEDMDGLNHDVTLVSNDMDDWSVMVTIETDARISDEYFTNADFSVAV